MRYDDFLSHYFDLLSYYFDFFSHYFYFLSYCFYFLSYYFDFFSFLIIFTFYVIILTFLSHYLIFLMRLFLNWWKWASIFIPLSERQFLFGGLVQKNWKRRLQKGSGLDRTEISRDIMRGNENRQ